MVECQDKREKKGDMTKNEEKMGAGEDGEEIKGIRDAGSTADFRMLFEILKF